MILVENKPALLRTKSEDLVVKSEDATTVKTQVPAVYRIKHGKIWPAYFSSIMLPAETYLLIFSEIMPGRLGACLLPAPLFLLPVPKYVTVSKELYSL